MDYNYIDIMKIIIFSLSFSALTSLKKPRHKGFLNTLLCCFGAKSKRPNPPIHAEDSKDTKAKNGTKVFFHLHLLILMYKHEKFYQKMDFHVFGNGNWLKKKGGGCM